MESHVHFFSIRRISEAEAALTGSILQRAKNVEDLTSDFGDASCFALALLGKIYW